MRSYNEVIIDSDNPAASLEQNPHALRPTLPDDEIHSRLKKMDSSSLPPALMNSVSTLPVTWQAPVGWV